MLQSELQQVLQDFYKKLYDEHATYPYAAIEDFQRGYGHLKGAEVMMQVALRAFEPKKEIEAALNKSN